MQSHLRDYMCVFISDTLLCRMVLNVSWMYLSQAINNIPYGYYHLRLIQYSEDPVPSLHRGCRMFKEQQCGVLTM